MVGAFYPKTLKEALDILAYDDCIVFAGGTDLMVKKKQWSGTCPSFERTVVFISDLKELKEIKIEDNYLVIGSACSLSQLIDSIFIPDFYKQVFTQMASPAVRSIATIGGNVCNSSPAGDCLPLLYALDAVLILQSSCRTREISISEFIEGPGKNILNAGELLTEIKLPMKSFSKAVYRKVGTRKATALSKLSFVGLADIYEDELRDIRIAFGAVAPTVVRCRDIESEIVQMSNKRCLNIMDVVKDYAPLIKPIDDQRSTALYRKEACIRLLTDFFSTGGV